MVDIRYAQKTDMDKWKEIDGRISMEELENQINLKRAWLILYENEIVGALRYNLFWDTIPFLTMIHLSKEYRDRGIGSKAMKIWESEMKKLHYKMIMTSTQIDEEAQHFYRKLGYVERGSLFLDGTPFNQAQEVILIKLI